MLATGAFMIYLDQVATIVNHVEVLICVNDASMETGFILYIQPVDID